MIIHTDTVVSLDTINSIKKTCDECTIRNAYGSYVSTGDIGLQDLLTPSRYSLYKRIVRVNVSVEELKKELVYIST